ncbi:hypothetical protein ONZ45_g16827 [Pleurotus djamor]|nr:hypothetical protein ONZ45_g16827 [Pleurotus djamor]
MHPFGRPETLEETKPHVGGAQIDVRVSKAKPHTKPRKGALVPYSDEDDDDDEIVLLLSAPTSCATTLRKPIERSESSVGPNDEGYQCPDHARCEKYYKYREDGKLRIRREGDRRWQGKDMCTSCQEREDGECIGSGCFRCHWCLAKKKKCSHSMVNRVSKCETPGTDSETEAETVEKKRKRSSCADDEESDRPRTRRNPIRSSNGARASEKGKQRVRKDVSEPSNSEGDSIHSESDAEDSDDENGVEELMRKWTDMMGRYDKMKNTKKQAAIAKAKKAIQKLGIIELQRMIQVESESQRILTELTKRSNEMVLAASSRLDKLM